MSKRVTIVLDDDIDKKLRVIQIKEMTKRQKPYSFSKALNDSLRRLLK